MRKINSNVGALRSSALKSKRPSRPLFRSSGRYFRNFTVIKNLKTDTAVNTIKESLASFKTVVRALFTTANQGFSRDVDYKIFKIPAGGFSSSFALPEIKMT